MSLEVIRVPNLSEPRTGNQKLKIFTLTILGLSFLFALKYNFFDNIFGSTFLFFIGFFFVLFIPFYWGVMIYDRGIYPQKNHKKKLSYLQNQNFNVDYAALGIAVDKKKRKIAFTLYRSTEIYIVDYSDVSSWSTYKEESLNMTSQGKIYHQTAHAVLVHIRNPDHPQFIFSTQNSTESTQWIARLNALIN